MARNTSNLRRGGPGRPKGSKDRVPRSFKSALRDVFATIHSEHPALIQQALQAGLRARPPKSYLYLQLYMAYELGKPTDRVHVTGDGTVATQVVHVHLGDEPADEGRPVRR